MLSSSTWPTPPGTLPASRRPLTQPAAPLPPPHPHLQPHHPVEPGQQGGVRHRHDARPALQQPTPPHQALQTGGQGGGMGSRIERTLPPLPCPGAAHSSISSPPRHPPLPLTSMMCCTPAGSTPREGRPAAPAGRRRRWRHRRHAPGPAARAARLRRWPAAIRGFGCSSGCDAAAPRSSPQVCHQPQQATPTCSLAPDRLRPCSDTTVSSRSGMRSIFACRPEQ
jgi:hypothetical protein